MIPPPLRPIIRALAPAAFVVLILGPVIFRMAEGAELMAVDGYPVDVYGLALYAIFLIALVGGIVTVYRSL